MGEVLQPWKYESAPGNSGLYIMVDIAKVPVGAGWEIHIRHNQAADGPPSRRFVVGGQEQPPSVDRVAGSTKFGQPVLHPRVRWRPLTQFGVSWRTKCGVWALGTHAFDDWWFATQLEDAPFPFNTRHYTSVPFQLSQIPTGLQNFTPC